MSLQLPIFVSTYIKNYNCVYSFNLLLTTSNLLLFTPKEMKRSTNWFCSVYNVSVNSSITKTTSLVNINFYNASSAIERESIKNMYSSCSMGVRRQVGDISQFNKFRFVFVNMYKISFRLKRIQNLRMQLGELPYPYLSHAQKKRLITREHIDHLYEAIKRKRHFPEKWIKYQLGFPVGCILVAELRTNNNKKNIISS